MKSKIVYVLVAGALLSSPASLFAQENDGERDGRPQPPSKEEMQQMKLSRLVNDLMLDDATAAKFTTLYEAYTKELEACMPERPQMKKGGGSKEQSEKPKALTDAEIEKNVKAQFKNERKLLDIRENYYEKFSKILTQKQVMKVMAPRFRPQGASMKCGDRGCGMNFDKRGPQRDFQAPMPNQPQFMPEGGDAE